MLLKRFSKAILIFSLTSLTFAEEELTGDCQEIETYLTKKDLNFNTVIGDTCVVNKDGKVINLNISSVDDEIFKDLLKYDTIENLYLFNINLSQSYVDTLGTLPNLNELTISTSSLQDNLNFGALENLPSLKLININSLNGNKNLFEYFKNLKKLSISQTKLQPEHYDSLLSLANQIEELTFFKHELPEFVYSLTNIKKLICNSCDLKTIPDPLLKLNTLEQLNLDFNSITTIPDNIVELKNLSHLSLKKNLLEKIPKALGNLEKLELLDLDFNKINDDLPESLNNLLNLKEIYLDNNENIKGKTLTNDNLITCDYNKNYQLCKAMDMKCLENYSFEPCDPPNPEPDNSNHGNGDDNVDDDDGDDDNDIETIISTDFKCGKGKGICPTGQCCSKYGWCGTSEKHCSVDLGCQMKYGHCQLDKISSNGRCDSVNGKCPAGYCCSKHGWCGKSKEYCFISEGCQSKFGECTEEMTYVKGKCGENYGHCPSGQCCSRYGWCGKNKDYCGVGCQNKYGRCDNIQIYI